MLKKLEAERLLEELKNEQKKAMKEILNSCKLAMTDDKFNLLKKTIFNNFGTSGLASSSEKIVEKYTEK